MRIQKTSETTPSMASVVNEINNSTTDTYSCKNIDDRFNGNRIYAQTEIDTGKLWIDGKHIYRKVYYNSSYSQNASTTADVSFSLPNLDNIVNVYGSAKTTNNAIYPLPNSMWANISGMQYSWNISSFTSSGFKINTGSDNPLSNMKIYLVIEYTKTTD